MECVFERCITTLDPAGLPSMKFIVYYDSLECSSCAVTHLMDLVPLYEKFENTDVGVMTIFSPRLEEVEDIKLELMLAVICFRYMSTQMALLQESIRQFRQTIALTTSL